MPIAANAEVVTVARRRRGKKVICLVLYLFTGRVSNFISTLLSSQGLRESSAITIKRRVAGEAIKVVVWVAVGVAGCGVGGNIDLKKGDKVGSGTDPEARRAGGGKDQNTGGGFGGGEAESR